MDQKSNQDISQDVVLRLHEDSVPATRKVHWSPQFEIIHYFVPLPQTRKSHWKKKIKRIKEKAVDLKYKPLLLLLESELIQFFNSGLDNLARKINYRSGKLCCEKARVTNELWDELFELYSTRSEGNSLERTCCNITKNTLWLGKNKKLNIAYHRPNAE